MGQKKTLLLIRHAEAQNLGSTELDQNRPLTEFGKLQAQHMGQKLASMRILPSLFISSPAVRTVQTAEIMIASLGLENKITFVKEPKVYNASTRMINEIINQIDEKHSVVALIGHNPTISQMVGYLSQHSINIMPTCGIVCLELNVEEWSLVTMGSCNFVWFDFPPHQLS
ncbi:MAG: histidine phosphatase family protein [Bacteroidia bacterium]|nr:histidine phosphatase family protein [Bacteroidia bacterium]MDW8157742.1 histidine phosphatase family protein [Bacteroidia bacterium]